MKEPLYHIVARNRLTGIREPFSRKGTKKEIQDILLQLRLTPSKDRPFTNPKIEVVTPTQTELCFKEQEPQGRKEGGGGASYPHGDDIEFQGSVIINIK